MRRWYNKGSERLGPGGVERRAVVDAPGGSIRRTLERLAGTGRQPLRLALIAAIGMPAGMALMAAGSAELAMHADSAVEEESKQLVTLSEGLDDTVARAWRKRMVERERTRAAEEYAETFSITTELAAEIYGAAQRHRIEPEIAFGLVRAESSFRRTVVSHAGAVGFTQLLPSTARWIAPGTTRSSLFDTATNLDVGFKYLRYLKDKYEGNVDLALTAYNRGQGRVDRDLRAGRNPDNGYANAVRTGHVSRQLARQNSRRG